MAIVDGNRCELLCTQIRGGINEGMLIDGLEKLVSGGLLEMDK